MRRSARSASRFCPLRVNCSGFRIAVRQMRHDLVTVPPASAISSARACGCRAESGQLCPPRLPVRPSRPIGGPGCRESPTTRKACHNPSADSPVHRRPSWPAPGTIPMTWDSNFDRALFLQLPFDEYHRVVTSAAGNPARWQRMAAGCCSPPSI